MKKFLLALIVIIIGVLTFDVLSVCAETGTYGDLIYEISNDEVTIVECNTATVDIQIPETIKGYPVTSIGREAFRDCKMMKNITIPSGIKTIGRAAFYNCDSLTNIKIPSGVINIEPYAFTHCITLTSIVIPDSVKSIGSCAFWQCKNITEVTLPNSITSIEVGVFSNCEKLTQITLPDTLISIESVAFERCSNLISIVIPNNFIYIKDSAFSYCSKLSLVCFKGSKEYWENNVVIYNGNENVSKASIIYDATPKTYKFNTNCDITVSDITDYAIFTMPSVANDEKTFKGWYDNEELIGNPVTFPYYGDATTLYAAWTDRTGKSFEDAFIAKANQKYTVTTTESGQYVYFEFVPNFSKEYSFYTTGSKDTYGYLYNSNKLQITSNDDGRDGNNFYISYNLTAGQTYYIAAKIYSGTGTFALVTEEPVDYRINEITIKDMSGNSLQAIPTGTFLATVSFTNVSSSADAVIILAQYTDAGAFKGLMYIQTEDVPTGSTIKLSIPVDNSKGDIAKLKAFCWETFGSLMPMGNSVSFPVE